jgi:hypothetical protein
MSTTRALANRTAISKLSGQLDYIILDASSSMTDKWQDCLASIDGYLTTVREAHVASHVILTTFSSGEVDLLQRDEPLADFKPLRETGLIQRGGMTPLYDAINIAGRTLRDLDPTACSVVIVTDGEEMGSHFTSQVQAAAVLDWMRAKGWQVTFIGADFNNAHMASLLGAEAGTSIGVAKARLLDAGKALGEKRIRYARSGDDMTFSDSEQQTFGGYLAGPSAGSK